MEDSSGGSGGKGKKLNAFYQEQYYNLVESVERLQKENRMLHEQLNEAKNMMSSKIKDVEAMTLKGSISLLLLKLALVESNNNGNIK